MKPNCSKNPKAPIYPLVSLPSHILHSDFLVRLDVAPRYARSYQRTDLMFAGWNKYSIGYFSADGFKSYNYPFTATSYGQPLYEGDVLGVGYRPRSGTVFFTRNGKRLEDAYVGFNKHNVFPTIGSDGPAVVHVNLGQSGFVFIEANVKKWGLAPSSGTLAPPPAYGSEGGSVLLETSGAQRDRQRQDQGQQDESGSLPRSFRTRRRSSGRRRHRHARVESFDGQPSQQEDAIPEEPEQYFSSSNASSRRLTPAEEVNEEDLQSHNPHNPPTPNMLDISLHSLRQPSNRPRSPNSDDSAVSSSGSSDGAASPRACIREICGNLQRR